MLQDGNTRLLAARETSSFTYTGDKTEYDFEVIHKKRVVQIDVKTKRCNLASRLGFEMSVPAYFYSKPPYIDLDYFLCVQVNSAARKKRLIDDSWISIRISQHD